MARPSSFTQETADLICEQLIAGRSLRSICDDEGMPAGSTVCRWLADNEPFRKQYAAAREAQADTLADEILDIADDARNDWMDRQVGEDTVRVLDHEHVSRSKLRLDARRWLAGKLAPKKYGDKMALVGGDAGDAPIAITSIKLVGPDGDR